MLANIADLKVNQIRIFPVDIVPIKLITTKSCVEKLRELLSIGDIEMRPSVDGKEILVLRKGEIRKDKKLIVINRIEIDARRIVLEVDGTSEDGNEVYETFISGVSTVAKVDSERLQTPLLKAETSQCVVTLDFALDALLSEVFTEFLNKKIEKEASSKLAKASVRPLAILTEISYEIKDKSITDNKITMNPKQFTIALRPGAPPEAKKYLISSPFDSLTHLKLIEELNKAVAGEE